MASYDQIYTAVMMYYDSSSEIYKKVTGGQGLTVGEMNAVLSSVPYMQPVTAIDNTRIGIDSTVTFKEPSKLEFIVGPDSNIPNSEYGDGFRANIPGSSTYDNTTNTFSFEPGVKDSVGNILPAIADKINLAVTGINIGAKLGYQIDEAIYQQFPDFWSDLFGDITPQDFANIFSEDTLGNKFVRTIFGLQPNGMTTYIPAEIIAEYVRALRDKGVFNNSDTYKITYTGNQNIPIKTISAPRDHFELTTFYTTGSSSVEEYDVPGGYGVCLTDGSFSIYTKNSSGYRKRSKKSDGSWNKWVSLGYPNTTYTISTGTRVSVYDRVYIGHGGVVADFSLAQQPVSSTQAAEILFGPNTVTHMPVVDGITQLPQSTPIDMSLITGTDDPTVISQLKQHYPDLFNDDDKVTVNVPQSDGSTRTIEYYPVPWPDGMTKNQPNPVTQPLPRPSTQPQPNPTTQTDVLIQDGPTIEDLIDYNTDPLEQPRIEPQDIPQPVDTPAPMPQPTPTPQQNTDPDIPSPVTTPPDTGDGETPPNVLPIGNASALWAVYNPSQAEVNAFGAWLWSDDFIDNLKRLFVSPMDGIIGIHKIYCTPPRGGSAPITVGYLQSDVSAITVPSQYKAVECGEVEVREQFGNVFDYEPYTKISCYLPFIGIVKLNTSDVMRSTVTINYTVDVYTGACYAEILCKRDGFDNVLYTFAGDSASHYPISSGSYSGIISGIVSAGAAAIAAGATMGVGAGILAGGTSLLTRNNRLTVQHSGGFSGNASVMGGKKPYLIIERPQVKLAESYPEYDGVPSNTTIAIGACKGYVKCKEVHLTIAGAYQDELDEIETLLKEGILI